MHLYCEKIVFNAIHPDESMGKWIYIFLIPVAIFETGVLHFFKNNLAAKIVTCVLSFIISAYYVIQFVYYSTFGSLISIGTIGLGGDALKDFGWTLKDILVENFWSIVALFVPFFLVLLFSIFYKPFLLSGKGPIIAIIFIVVSVLCWYGITLLLPLEGTEDHTAYGAYYSQFVDTDTASKKLGAFADTIIETKMKLFGSNRKDEDFVSIDDPIETHDNRDDYNMYKDLDFAVLKEKDEDSLFQSLCDYLASVKPTKKNDYTGVFKDYNVVYICAEAFDTGAIDKDITPTLYRLANGGIVLNNYYNSFPNTTTNGEYALLTGLWPDVSRSADLGRLVGSMPASSDKNMQIALGNMLNKARGVQSLGFHNFKGSYYGREDSLPNFGFECKFMGSGMKFTSYWPSSDLEMFEQSVKDYVNSEEPFCAYYMTFSGHGSYTTENAIAAKNYEEVEALAQGRGFWENTKCYFACNMELDKALEYLLSELEKAGKLDNTLIVIAGDHYPYYINRSTYKNLYGEERDDDFGMFKSTCIMWVGSHEDDPLIVDDYCCNVDILPTVLNLLGIEYDSRLYAGRDIFSDVEHMAVLYNKNFITDKVQYNNETGEATWFVDDNFMPDEDKEVYLERCINEIKNRYQVSVKLPEIDFYQKVFDYLDEVEIQNNIIEEENLEN